jgi:hypothetical protein
MDEKKREENKNPTNSSSTTTTTMTFSDEIPTTTTTTTNTTLFPFQPSISTFFDNISSSDQKASSFGFMDMLGSHDYINNNFLLSDWGLPTVATTHHPLPSPASSNVPDSSGTLNTPASPNSTSISSSSNEATVNESLEQNRSKVTRNEHDAEVEEDVNGGRGDEQDQDKTKKQ